MNWVAVFPGEPETLDTLKAKYSDRTEMTGSTSYNFILVPGPKLFVVATDALHLKAADAAIISHGAGVWLLGDKADKYQADHPRAWSDLLLEQRLGIGGAGGSGFQRYVYCFKKIKAKSIMGHVLKPGRQL